MLVQVQLAATLYEDFNTKSKTESSPERLLLVFLGPECRIFEGLRGEGLRPTYPLLGKLTL